MKPPSVQARLPRERVLAFRLAGHNLAQPLPGDGLLAATGACGLQSSQPDGAALALRARLRDLAPGALEDALAARSLLQAWSLRGVPHIFPVADAPIFTQALLPRDEDELRLFLPGLGPGLDRVGLDGLELVERAAAALLAVLDGRQLPFRQLSYEVTARLASGLSPDQLAGWLAPSWYGPHQLLGEALVHFAFRPLALHGLLCHVGRQGAEAAFARVDQWLGRKLPSVDPDQARVELARRYLRCYGPSTAVHFGEWAGIAPAAAQRAWQGLSGALVAVEYDDRILWLHEGDLPTLLAPPPCAGVRLLPPYDPYLAQRDRDTLLPERERQRQVWRPQGNPGVVLIDGQVVGLWRPEKRGRRLHLRVEAFTTLAAPTREAIAGEAERLARFRGCAQAETAFADDSG